MLFVVLATIVAICLGLFAGTFTNYAPVTLASDRTGLVLESGAKVKLRGVEVGRVAAVTGGAQPVSLKLEMFPDQLRFIPANVGAEIRATTAFGAKYVDLIYPDDPSPQRLRAGQILQARNVSTEVNTVFENLVGVLHQIDVAKLNATLTALADGVRGQGPRIGEATSAANEVLLALNPRMDTVAQDWRSFKGFTDAYGAAAQDILATLDAASTTSSMITGHAKDLDALLLNAIGFSTDATNLLAPNKDNLVQGINRLAPTTDLLLKYNPEYTCLLQGAKFFLDHGGYEAIGGNGKSIILDAALLLGDDPYRYPQNLPIVAAKGGPGGKPSCGSLPDVRTNFPVRKLITNTGWGTGLDWRPNPGIGHPWYVDYFPATRAVPEPPSMRGMGPPAIGPVPYPGAPPYGAPLYGPGGVPLYPGVPPAPQPDTASPAEQPPAPPPNVPTTAGPTP
ncbi:MCE family protein [Mycobacterium sp. ELW1]|nr:MCE family protein [Mycobacterium sp. ELW1]